MDLALSALRSVLLGALGGLAAYGLAAALGLGTPAPVPPAAASAGTAAALQPVAAAIDDGRNWPDGPSHEAARRFIVEAADAWLFDAQAARLVHRRSGDAAVQALAASLLRDHRAVWPALEAIASQRGVALPQAPSRVQRERLALLGSVAEHTGARLFVRHVGVDGALAEIARCERALALLDERDEALRGWIAQALPALRERAALAGRLAIEVSERRPMA
jgi:putative membrane protein